MIVAPHPLVAVHPTRFKRGVEAPSSVTTYDWRQPPGSPANRHGVMPWGEVLEIEAACARRWATDAHYYAYVLHGADGAPLARQPRVNKGGLEWVREQGFALRVAVLSTDLDTPGHVPWSALPPEALERALDEAREVPALRSGLWYFSSRGRRLVHRLGTAVDVGEIEPVMLAWFDELEAQGLTPDRACGDWTRSFRLPWVARADGFAQHQTVWLDDFAPREAPVPTGRPRVRAYPARARTIGGVDFAASLPPEWRARAGVLAEAVRAVATEWHPLFLALGGALCQGGAPLGLVPAILAAVTAATGVPDARARDRVDAGRTTVRRFAAGEPFVGADQLLVGWPDVAAALEQVLAARAPRARADELPPAAGAALEAAEAIRTARDGVTIVAAGCGVGKTRAATTVAVERAGGGRAASGRARPGTRTGVSVPTNALARQVAGDVRARGTAVLRLFSPISELDAQGAAVCRFVESGRALARGHLSVPWEMCDGRDQDPCPHRASCPAAGGREGPDDALVVVGNHGLLGAVMKSAGKTGLRVIDEPPPLLATEALTAMDFAAWRQHAHMFERSFAAAVGWPLRALEIALEEMPADDAALPVVDLLSEEIAAPLRDLPPPASGPPVRWVHVHRAREQAAFAADLGRAARAAWLAYRAVTSAAPWVARREDRRGVPTLLVTGPDEAFVAVLRAEGSTVVLDAAPDVAVLSAAAGYDLAARVTRVHARDGAPVTRTLLHWSQGSRRALFEGGRPQIRRFAGGLRAALAWASEDPGCRALGLITLKPFRQLLEHALCPEDEKVAADARKAGLTARVLAEAVEVLGPLARGWPGTFALGHYGAVRGLDAWKESDALVTIADPWPHLGDVRNDVAYLGGRLDADKRLEWLAQVELEQAHGRLRAPHRDRPGRALHVGRVTPGGPGWEGAERRRLAEGRPPNDQAATVEQLRVWIAAEYRGSVRAAARALGLDDKAVRNYLRGSRAIPAAVAERVKGADESPYRESPNRTFVRAEHESSSLKDFRPHSGTTQRVSSEADADESLKDFRPHFEEPETRDEEEVA